MYVFPFSSLSFLILLCIFVPCLSQKGRASAPLGVQSAGLAWIQQADSAEAALITTPQSAAETPTATTEAGARNETSRKAGCKESVQSRNQVHVSIQTQGTGIPPKFGTTLIASKSRTGLRETARPSTPTPLREPYGRAHIHIPLIGEPLRYEREMLLPLPPGFVFPVFELCAFYEHSGEERKRGC